MNTTTAADLAVTAAAVAADAGSYEGMWVLTGHGYGEQPARLWSAARFTRNTVSLVLRDQDGRERVLTVDAGQGLDLADTLPGTAAPVDQIDQVDLVDYLLHLASA